MSKVVVIAGAGPAGLTAAYELSSRSSDFHPIVFEATGNLGGISRTVVHNGNRMDIGGHRFFTKNQRVKRLWHNLMPVAEGDLPLQNEAMTQSVDNPLKSDSMDTGTDDCVMLRRRRLSRIFYLKHLFDYPVTLSISTLSSLGFSRTVKAAMGLLRAKCLPKPETSLENFYINRFGKTLYTMFFEDYTQKVWGKHPSLIDPAWGRQRVKGVSLTKILQNMIESAVGHTRAERDIEPSLINHFVYPKYGPGQLWEKMARESEEHGSCIIRNVKVDTIRIEKDRVVSVTTTDGNGHRQTTPCEYFLSSMSIKDLIGGMKGIKIPEEVRTIAASLPYRDFITVGLLVDYIKMPDGSKATGGDARLLDTWIYVQEPYVKLGRIQIFNNWSPYLIADKEKIWIGLEYFCNEGDQLWEMSEADFVTMAQCELSDIGFIDPGIVRDTKVVKVLKAYPAYFDTYTQFDVIRKFLDRIDNLYCIGRNGQHRYNNMDHSMLTAMEAADCIICGRPDKQRVWNVNTESEYHEESR